MWRISASNARPFSATQTTPYDAIPLEPTDEVEFTTLPTGELVAGMKRPKRWIGEPLLIVGHNSEVGQALTRGTSSSHFMDHNTPALHLNRFSGVWGEWEIE